MEHDEVHDRDSFLRYVAQLRAELDDPVRAKDWENQDLSSFFEAMEAWVTDCKDRTPNANPWRHAADLLTAAIVYE